MRYLFNCPLGVGFAPIGQPKCIAPAVLAGIIAGGSALVSGVGNLVSQVNSNSTNRAIADSQMQFAKEQYERERLENRDLIQSQRSYEDRVRAEQNFYNSPAQERERLLAAGINPALAKYGSLGSASSASGFGSGAGVGTPASFKMPESYKQQPLNFDAVANALSTGVDTYYRDKDRERADYALASDITFRSMDSKSRLLDSYTKAKEAGVNEKWIDDQIQRAWKDVDMQERRFEHDKQVDAARQAIDDRLASVEEAKVHIQQVLADSQIQVNAATVANLAQLVSESKERVIEMRRNGISKREIDYYVAQQEKKANKLLEYELGQKKFNNKGFRGKVTKSLNFMFEPLKGLFSASASTRVGK